MKNIKKINKDFPELLSAFFSQYLGAQRGCSQNTIKSYRDAFILFFRYLSETDFKKPESLTMEKLTPEIIYGFLKWLEDTQGTTISTRNNRLAAIRSFANYVVDNNPEYIEYCSKILKIKAKKYDSKPPVYLSLDELRCILSKPDTTTKTGLKDLALLSLLYDSGARVSEIINSLWLDLRLSEPATITLTGKGNKTRIVPLMPDTIAILQAYKKSIKEALY